MTGAVLEIHKKTWGKFPESVIFFFGKKYRLALFTFFFGTSLFLFLLLYRPTNYTKYLSVIASTGKNTLQISTFLGAILIGTISTKIYNVRKERLEILPELRKLTIKLNSYRKICNILIINNEFWVKNSRLYVKKHYPNLNFSSLHESTLVDHKYAFEKEMNRMYNDEKVSSDIYLQLELLATPTNEPLGDILYTENDIAYKYPYTFIRRLRATGYGNGFWKYFKDKWAVYGSFFNFNSITNQEKRSIEKEARKIDQDFLNREFNKELLVDIGNKMLQEIIPRMHVLSYEVNKPTPRIINTMWSVLVVLVIWGILPGVFGPIFDFEFTSSALSIATISSIVIYLVFKLKLMAKKEINTDDSPYWDGRF